MRLKKRWPHPAFWQTIGLHSVLIFFCFYGLGSYPLLDNNEGLYSAIARDMAISGDWVIPHLNGVPYLEKPPLLYGMMALIFKIFGVHTWGARFIPACAAYGILWRLSCFIPRHTPHTPHIPVWLTLMASALSVLIWSRMVLLDMAMTFWLTQSLLCFYDFWSNRAPASMRWSWVWLACAVLTKGFVAMILWGLVAGCFLLWQRTPLIVWRQVIHPYGLGLFILILSPWHIWAMMRDPHFAFFYFINEHVLRFFDLREPRDYYTGPWYYYIIRLPVMTWPWWGLWARIGVLPKQPSHPLRVFATVWLCAMLLFFSVSRAKANYYMLAAFPALFLMISLSKHPTFPRGTLAWGAGSILSVQSMLMILNTCFPSHLQGWDISARSTSVYLGLMMLLGIGASYSFIKKHHIALWSSTIAISGLFLIELIEILARNPDIYSSQNAVACLPQHQSCFLFQDFEDRSSLAFYHPHPWIILESTSRDLLYGQTHDPGNAFMSMYTFNQRTCPDWIVLKPHKKSLFFAQCTRRAVLLFETERLVIYKIEPFTF